jgi:TRAP-type uncharacterized transport system substrate-binding protein
MRRIIVFAIGAGVAAIAVVGFAVYLYERPSLLRIAVTRDSDDQAIMTAAAQQFAEDRQSIRLKLVIVDTLAESSRAFEEERADLAIVRGDIAMPVTGQSVLIMRRNAAVLFAPAQSSLRSVEDLRGRKVGILQSEEAGRAGNQVLLDAVLAQYDVAPGSVRRTPLSLAELPKAIERKEIDVVLVVDAPGSSSLTQAVAALAQVGHGPPIFIPIAEAKAIAQRSPIFESIEVIRGAFGGALPKPAASFETLGVSTRLIARRNLSNAVIAELTESLLMARPSLATHAPSANRIEPPSTDKGAALPVHPGALAYLGDEEQSFFDTYSDFIYIGAMLFSVLGTGAAAIVARFNQRQNSDFERILQRLIEIIKAARCAERPDTLNELESEADELLTQALALDSSHALSGHRLAATSLALNQIRHAIAERRHSFIASVRAPFAPRVVGD